MRLEQRHCLPTLSIIMVGAGNMFSADLVFLSSDLSTSRLLGCFSRKVELVLALPMVSRVVLRQPRRGGWMLYSPPGQMSKEFPDLSFSFLLHLYLLSHLLAVDRLVGQQPAQLVCQEDGLGYADSSIDILPHLCRKRGEVGSFHQLQLNNEHRFMNGVKC